MCRKNMQNGRAIKKAWLSHKPQNWTKPFIFQSLLEFSFLQQNLLKKVPAFWHFSKTLSIKLGYNNTRPKRRERERLPQPNMTPKVHSNKLQKQSPPSFFQKETNPNPGRPDLHLWQAWSCHQFEELLLLLQSQTVKQKISVNNFKRPFQIYIISLLKQHLYVWPHLPELSSLYSLQAQWLRLLSCSELFPSQGPVPCCNN